MKTYPTHPGLIAAILVLLAVPAAAAAAPPAVSPTGFYIVLFDEAPLARYAGGVPGLAATNPAARGERKLDANSAESRAYLAYLEHRQAEHLAAVEHLLGRSVSVLYAYRAAGNGVAVRLSPAEAAAVAELDGVRRVVPDALDPMDTDRGPLWIGAPGIWDGSQTGGLPGTKGEGVIVGVIDSGVNMVHPSFSDAPADGHVYTNPLGSGTFGGWCDPGNPNFDPSYACNDKLFTAWDFTDAFCAANPGTCSETDGPEDDNGHGSHTASTAAGNTLTSPAISGVAPHANLITYDGCYTNAAGQGLCPFVSTSAGVDQAILDGVDAINYSISGGNSPWGGDIDTFFLDAVAAGAFVAASAGNAGPGPSTVAHRGPWMTTVGASTHDRDDVINDLVDMSGGTSPPADMAGASRTAGYGPAPIVHAGDFSNGDPNPEQCLNPFPGGTWTGGEIVMCDRGTIARVLKCAHVAAGGAAGCILGNVAEVGVVADAHVIPAIHVDQTEANALRTWLATAPATHMGEITGSTVVTDPALGDIMADFSSRGPNTSFDVLKPDVTNPGVNIFAAYFADFIPGLPGAAFNAISGTSMSSPHTAGSGALLAALHPSWTPSEIKSALMTTADLGVLKENGTTPADAHDIGGGRVDLSRAGRAGLILDETAADYLAANPGIGGDPRTLNIASFNHSACAGTCTWTRTVENATGSSVTWEASEVAPPGLYVRCFPTSFTLAPGATQTITVDVHVGLSLPLGSYRFGQLVLTPDLGGVPDTHMPVAIVATAASTVFTDGFESGNTSAWSFTTP